MKNFVRKFATRINFFSADYDMGLGSDNQLYALILYCDQKLLNRHGLDQYLINLLISGASEIITVGPLAEEIHDLIDIKITEKIWKTLSDEFKDYFMTDFEKGELIEAIEEAILSPGQSDKEEKTIIFVGPTELQNKFSVIVNSLKTDDYFLKQ